MRIGSRGSSLARVQAEQVAKLLGGDVEVVIVTTSGDRAAGDASGASGDRAAGDASGAAGDRAGGDASGAAADKSRWVDAIEQALLAGEIDLAVHSAKDVPTQLAPGLALLGSPSRAPVADALCGGAATTSLAELPDGARVGTSSLRRAAQLLAARPDLDVRTMKGNVDTRLGKLATGDLDAIVLARAGLRRLGREQEIGALLDPQVFVPSPGQGALALEGRAEDPAAAAAARSITDPGTLDCLIAERALARALNASCNTPLGAWCQAQGDGEQPLRLRGWVGLPDGSAWIADELAGADPETLAATLAERMRAVGATEMLARAEAMAL
jgi:hydroxymethylbilane synthase